MIYLLFYQSFSLLQATAARKNISIEHQLLVRWELYFIWPSSLFPSDLWPVELEILLLLCHASVLCSAMPHSLTVECFSISRRSLSQPANIILIDGAEFQVGVPCLDTRGMPKVLCQNKSCWTIQWNSQLSSCTSSDVTARLGWLVARLRHWSWSKWLLAALSSSEPAKLTEIARSCGQAIPVVFIPYLCILAIKYDE